MEFSDELLRRAAELNLQAKKMVSALLSGNYRSSFRGSGMQFKEFRRYEPGDDVRHIHWQVTAKTGHPTIKVYEEERELDILLMVDTSGSSLFGSQKKRKIDMYGELTALLGLAAIRSRDNVGLLLFDSQPIHYLPPRNTRNQVLQAVSTLLKQTLELKSSDLRPALHYASQVLRKRSLIIILSDFFLPEFKNEFQNLAQKHEVILIQCYDDAERGSSLGGIHEVWDPETNEYLLLDSNSRKARSLLATQHILLQHSLEELCLHSKADYLTLSIEDDYLQRLVHFFRQRGPSRL